MRIGIDAKWYFEGPPSGKRVVKSLVDAMLAIDDENEFFILLNQTHKDRPFPAKTKKNVTVRYVWAGNNLLSNVFVLPFLSNKFKLDCLLYQNFISPLAKGKRIAYIHDVLFLSNPEFYTLFERLYFAPLKFLTKRSHLIITVSEEEKKRLLNFGFSGKEKNIVVAYHGVDPHFSPKENHSRTTLESIKQKFSLPERFLLYVGRLNLRKNVDHLLRALPLLKDKSIPLVIVGADNWKKSNHSRIIEELHIGDRIHFTGAVYNELGVIYSMASVFCFPSYAESFGLPPLEAMASGIPVVVSNTTSLPEICGDAGHYVHPDRPDEIAAGIDKLLGDPEYYASKKKAGLIRAKKFTWENTARTVIASMNQIVKV